MASTYGEITGIPGVVIVTKGPGVTNLVSGIAAAYLDRRPIIIFSAIIDPELLAKNPHQDVELVSFGRLITKLSEELTSKNAVELLDRAYRKSIEPRPGAVYLPISPVQAIQDIDIMDVVIDEDIRESFINNCHNLILFDYVYENMIANLVSMAREANESKSIPYDFISDLLEKTIQDALKLDAFKDHNKIDIQRSFALWMERLTTYSGCSNFLKSVEEWICVVHKDKSDTLFVIVSFFFEKILPEYYASLRSGSQFEGKIKPARIGRRKDFWNRLNIASVSYTHLTLPTKA